MHGLVRHAMENPLEETRMSRINRSLGLAVAALLSSATVSHAGITLGTPLGSVLPSEAGGLLGIVAAAVVVGIYLVRRKR
jgi:hypothetical protein